MEIGTPETMATRETRARYDRLAPFYDVLEGLTDRRYRPWRRKLWDLAERLLPSGGSLIEIGVGTGKNIPYWPADARITAIDLAPRMLVRAVDRARRLDRSADFRIGDVERIKAADNTFDLAVATLVFCSVAEPVRGLAELKRIVRPGGHVLLLEHVRSSGAIHGAFMDLFNPLIVKLLGRNINRRTLENVRRAGLEIVLVEALGIGGNYKLVHAQVPAKE